MPYISPAKRPAFDVHLRALPVASNPGELNYVLSRIARRYVESHGGNYTAMNDVVGAFESAKAEFQRRVVAPYEDAKIRENGDIYA